MGILIDTVIASGAFIESAEVRTDRAIFFNNVWRAETVTFCLSFNTQCEGGKQDLKDYVSMKNIACSIPRRMQQ